MNTRAMPPRYRAGDSARLTMVVPRTQIRRRSGMTGITFRPYRSPEDLDHQYRLWTAATEGLPFAWRSNPVNVRHISQHAPKYPGSRLFAERDGQVVGYIGTH